MSRLSLRAALAVGLVAIIAIGVTMGLNLAGSPAEARKRRLDDRRLDDLRQIQAATDLYWSRRRLTTSRARSQSGQVQKDPIRDVDGCRARERPLRALRRFERDGGTRRWTHTAGRICFTLESESGQAVNRHTPRFGDLLTKGVTGRVSATESPGTKSLN
jgi:hypothetical protein